MIIKRILDLFCGAGGAARGLRSAFPEAEIVGVDHVWQKRYPYTFVQSDAMDFPLEGYDLIWASLPCQHYSRLKHFAKRNYGSHIPALRARLKASGKSYVIENVPLAPLINPLTLCGTMFGLNTIKHRLFEINPAIWFPPATCSHLKKTVRAGRRPADNQYHCIAGNFADLPGAKKAMGIDWMTRKKMLQAIPRIYAEWIGRTISQRLIVSNQLAFDIASADSYVGV